MLGFEYNYLDFKGELVTARVYYEKNLQGDVIGIVDARGIQIATYSYDAWGNITNSSYVEGNEIPYELNHIMYRGYYKDSETGFYYLQSRYYDAKIGRFINADNVIDTESIFGSGLWTYCESNPIMYYDPSGYGKTYVIYYKNNGSGFEEQVNHSPYFNKKSKNVIIKSVNSATDFKNAWNSMSGDINYVYLYLHGGKGILYFKNSEMAVKEIKKLEKKKVKYRVYLFACHGGDGKESNNVAWAFAKLSSAKVIACTGSVSYSKMFGKYYARKAWDWGIIKTFYYEKKYVYWGSVVAKSYWGQ